jgi:hypothetical protein
MEQLKEQTQSLKSSTRGRFRTIHDLLRMPKAELSKVKLTDAEKRAFSPEDWRRLTERYWVQVPHKVIPVPAIFTHYF